MASADDRLDSAAHVGDLRPVRPVRRPLRGARSVSATLEGLAGHDHEMTDFSPDGFEERNEHDRATLRTLTSAAPEGDRDRIAGDVLREALETNVELYDAGEHLRDLNVIASPVQAVRMCFDMT